MVIGKNFSALLVNRWSKQNWKLEIQDLCRFCTHTHIGLVLIWSNVWPDLCKMDGFAHIISIYLLVYRSLVSDTIQNDMGVK